MTEGKNFSGQVTPGIIDTEYVSCNFSQPVPIEVGGKKRGMRLFPGDDTSRTFTNCNLCNCEPPPDSEVTGCMTAIKEFNVESNPEAITIDGESATVVHHVDRVHGFFDPATGGYTDLTVPEDIEVD